MPIIPNTTILLLLVCLATLVGGTSDAAAQGLSQRTEAIEFWGAPQDTPGFPLHRNYTPEDYGSELYSQNWDVTQGADGVIYAANPGGVLAYDGASWRLIPTERQTLVRTLVSDDAGQVFVGAYGEFGRLAPDSTGTQAFVSLLPHVPESAREFGHIWSGAVTSDGVYFQTRRSLFRWDGEAVTTWQTSDSTRFFKVFSVHDTLYVAQENVGLLALEDDTLRPVSGNSAFAGSRPTVVLPYGRRELLVGTTSSDLFVRSNGRFVPFTNEAGGFLKQNELYDGVVLPDGAFALGTLWGGVAIVDESGRIRRILDEQSGLIDQDVKGLFVDRDGSLWMACEKGLSRADLLLPLSIYDERAGLDGAALSLTRHRGRIFVGASSGLFRLDVGDGPARPQFQPFSSLRAQVFDMLSTPWGLLAATDRGVYAFRTNDATRGTAEAVAVGSARSAFGLYRSRLDPSTVFVGYIDGIRVLKANASARQSTASRPDVWAPGSSVPGLNKGIFFMEEDRNGTLWASSAYSGLWRIDAPLSPTPVVEEIAPEGQTPQHVYRLAYLTDDNALRIVTREGLARPVRTPTGATDLVLDTTFARHLPPAPGRILNVEVAPDGDQWVFTPDATYLISVQPDGAVERSTPFASVSNVNAYAALAEAQRGFWIAGENGLLHHHPHPSSQPTATVRTLIRRVTHLGDDRVLFGGSPVVTEDTPDVPLVGPGVEPPLPDPRKLSASFSGLRFEFAAPGFVGDESNVVYRHRLVGFDEDWSPWAPDAKKEFTGLPPGRYVFEVEAQHPRVWTAQTASFAFRVLPPWYRTVWAYLLYGLLLVGAVAVLVQWRTSHLAQRKARLEAIVAERTVEVKNQAQQLKTYNRELLRSNEELQSVVEEKSKLLGVAAHDLKNPLFGIRALSEVILERNDTTDPIARKVDLIRQSADETLGLINELLSSAASTAGFNMRMETVDIAALVEWIVHGFRPQAERKNQILTCSVPPELCFIKGDPRKLREAMNNLISNAIKYSPKDAPIEVELVDYEDEVHFSVRDHGPGLSPEDQMRLFQPFQRLTPKPTGDEASSGLGLYIVKEIVEMHDGRIDVKSEVGKGSTFRIILPVSPIPEFEASEDDDLIVGQPSGDSTGESSSSPPSPTSTSDEPRSGNGQSGSVSEDSDETDDGRDGGSTAVREGQFQ